MRLLSYTRYAKHRGCALATVQQAIKEGRISDAIVIGEKGIKYIHVELADDLWAQNTDPARANNSIDSTKSYDPRPKGTGVSDTVKSDPIEPEQKGPNFQQNRAIREAYAARMAKLTYEKQAGKLLEAEKVKEYIAKVHSRARDSLLNMPDKLGPKLAAETDIHKVIEMLQKEIQLVCEQFSKGELDF